MLGMINAEHTSGEPARADIGIRVAIYPDRGHPEVLEVAAASPRGATAKFLRLVMDKVVEGFPEEALREILDNLVHAGYRGVVVSVLDEGRSVRVSDKGSGIEDKERAMEFGFSGASAEALRHIRGVGAGLGIAREAAARAGGTVKLEDNIGGGTVVTISVATEKEPGGASATQATRPRYPDAVPKINLSERQQKVLITVMEGGEVGPSTVAETLEISVSTAYRDLSVLEEQGLLLCDESGKRVISPLGRDLVQAIISGWV